MIVTMIAHQWQQPERRVEGQLWPETDETAWEEAPGAARSPADAICPLSARALDQQRHLHAQKDNVLVPAEAHGARVVHAAKQSESL